MRATFARVIEHLCGAQDIAHERPACCAPSAVVALTYRATVDVPLRFRKSKSVGAVFGLTCSRLSIRRDRLERQNIALWR